ncbi:hypothetical protein [uncultured Paenibacillus sp.]|uniref:hypothetical protein n=1 Tax=uncultured Paenibacillus sp. TaxID=227322 RepID=UPI0028D8D28D|nr:hypothetical protein [uncultured Paenibacillus sp.]
MEKLALSADFFETKLSDAKVHFERALDCKHTEFDDLYPYMIEHPQFFWYKRYVAWSELLTIVKLAEELNVEWRTWFTGRQVEYIEKRVMSSRVLDEWYETNDSREQVVNEENV